jgi:propanediol dehydratase large subunit
MENNPLLWQAVAKVASLTEEAGVDIDDLVKMLDAGMTPADLVEVVALKLTAPLQ